MQVKYALHLKGQDNVEGESVEEGASRRADR
jgi:hypothetical protein